MRLQDGLGVMKEEGVLQTTWDVAIKGTALSRGRCFPREARRPQRQDNLHTKNAGLARPAYQNTIECVEENVAATYLRPLVSLFKKSFSC